jgi:hypothetical protein
MKKEKKVEMECKRMPQGGDAVYGVGMVGAAVYFISTATSFWVGVLGVLKAMVWPAFMVYYLLEFLLK